MRPTSVLLCFGAMHIIAPSPTLSSEPVIGVPSAFDTNIYTRHKQARALTSWGSQTQPPSPVHEEKLPSVCLVTASEKDVIKRGEEGDGREEGREGGGDGERLLHLSQVRLGSQGSPKPFSFAKD